jgi:chromosome segregation ATPase
MSDLTDAQADYANLLADRDQLRAELAASRQAEETARLRLSEQVDQTIKEMRRAEQAAAEVARLREELDRESSGAWTEAERKSARLEDQLRRTQGYEAGMVGEVADLKRRLAGLREKVAKVPHRDVADRQASADDLETIYHRTYKCRELGGACLFAATKEEGSTSPQSPQRPSGITAEVGTPPRRG